MLHTKFVGPSTVQVSECETEVEQKHVPNQQCAEAGQAYFTNLQIIFNSCIKETKYAHPQCPLYVIRKPFVPT